MFRKIEKRKRTAHAAGCSWELGEKAGLTVAQCGKAVVRAWELWLWSGHACIWAL